MTKKPHPADAGDAEIVANAVRFELSIFRGRGKYATETAATLAEAKAKAADLEATNTNGKKAMIYAIDAAGRRALYVEPHNGIPAFLKRDHDPVASAMTALRDIAAQAGAAESNPQKPPETSMAKPAAPKGKAVAAKPAKPAPPKAAKAKPGKPGSKAAAAKGNGKPATKSGSKSETVLAMLRKGATRKQIVEKTGWQVDLKQFAARKGLTLKKDQHGVITAH